MTPLRQRMLEDMQIRNLSPLTQRAYAEHVSRFARHFEWSPAIWGLRKFASTWCISPTTGTSHRAASSITVAALRFLYTVTLPQPWSVQAVIPAPKQPQTVP